MIEYGGPSGAELLDALRDVLTRYVVLPSEQAADAVTLWIAATHAQPAWEHAPRLVITAPEKRCGKSRLLDVVEATCFSPLITVNASVAAVVRSIGIDPPTLLVDESDTIFGPKAKTDHEDLRGILNAGHQRNRPSIRFNVNKNSVEQLETFAMAALAGIGDMPDTIMDRAVVVRMRRRAPGETVSPYRTRRDRPALEAVAEQAHEWVRDHISELESAVPDMPVEDRAADTWEPLLAVADLAGGTWPERARQAARGFSDAADEADADANLSMRLLSDLRDVFGDATALHTSTILERLHKIEDAPWSNFFGSPLDPRGLGRKLKPYGVRTKNVRLGEKVAKGIERGDLHDAWTRYLPENRYIRYTGNSPGQAVADTNPVADASATAESSATGMTCNVTDVADVADTGTQLRIVAPTCPDCAYPIDTDEHAAICEGADVA